MMLECLSPRLTHRPLQSHRGLSTWTGRDRERERLTVTGGGKGQVSFSQLPGEGALHVWKWSEVLNGMGCAEGMACRQPSGVPTQGLSLLSGSTQSSGGHGRKQGCPGSAPHQDRCQEPWHQGHASGQGCWSGQAPKVFLQGVFVS